MMSCRPRRRFFASNRGKRGFTLIETMMALVIMVLLTTMVATGIPTAIETYQKSVDAANGEVALTTTSALLRDELGLAQDVYYDKSTGAVVYYKTSDGYWAMLKSSGTEGEGLVKEIYKGADPENLTLSETTALVPNETLPERLKVTFENLTYADGLFTVTGLQVVDKNGGTMSDAGVGEGVGSVLNIRASML